MDDRGNFSRQCSAMFRTVLTAAEQVLDGVGDKAMYGFDVEGGVVRLRPLLLLVVVIVTVERLWADGGLQGELGSLWPHARFTLASC